MKRICFIGAVGHSRQAFLALSHRTDCDLVGYAPESALEESCASPFSGVPYFSDYLSMLDTTEPDLAVVSPVFSHTGRVIMECARRGIDVFSEKPIAASTEELTSVLYAVRAGGIRLSAMHYLRYDSAFYTAAQLVRGGAIGQVVLINTQKSYKWGTRPAWYADRAHYTGTVPWVGIHAIDWIYYFSGRRFSSVTSYTYGASPETGAICSFVLQGGALATISIDYHRPTGAPTHGDDRIRCVGTDGVIEVCDGRILLTDGGGVREIAPAPAPDPLLEFIDGGDILPMDEVFYLTRVALLARDSADMNKTLDIED